MRLKLTMMMAAVAVAASCGCYAQNRSAGGGIDATMVEKIKKSYTPSRAEKALHNALSTNAIDKLARNAASKNNFSDKFSHHVPSKGITDQKQSGRCWLFTGLNMLRSQMIADNDLPGLELSQGYNFFYDQLEKSNLFLQAVIDTWDKSMDDRTVDWLFSHPLSDGGTFTGVADLVTKYGVVPAEVMVESYSTENTSKLSQLLGWKLREYGLELRRMKESGKSDAQVQERKAQMLETVYRMLAQTFGTPPAEFTWTRRDKDGNAVSTKTYTPQSFYSEMAGNDLQNGYVMLMNDPSRPYWKLYEIEYDRHAYDGHNWQYVNVPMEEIKQMAIKSIKDSTMMYFSCDVGKYLDRENGTLDLENFDYGDLFGTDFPMNKADRIRSHASASSHAMTLAGVDLDADGKPVKWLIENSWGPGANDGHLIATDPWMDEYLFRLVVEKKYAPKKVLDLLKTQPVMLPAWDPLF